MCKSITEGAESLIGWGEDSGVGGTEAGWAWRSVDASGAVERSLGKLLAREGRGRERGRGCSFRHAPAEWGSVSPRLDLLAVCGCSW